VFQAYFTVHAVVCARAKKKAMEIDDLTALDTHQAARILGVEPGTLSVWRVRQTGPRFYFSGAKPVYYLPDLRQFQEECRVAMCERSKRAAANGKRGRGRPKRE
jgi:hypothetical protein